MTPEERKQIDGASWETLTPEERADALWETEAKLSEYTTKLENPEAPPEVRAHWTRRARVYHVILLLLLAQGDFTPPEPKS